MVTNLWHKVTALRALPLSVQYQNVSLAEFQTICKRFCESPARRLDRQTDHSFRNYMEFIFQQVQARSSEQNMDQRITKFHLQAWIYGSVLLSCPG
jgi:hypothetical protein